MLRNNKRAQSLIEYAMLIGVVAMALSAMFTYMRYSINYRLKQAQQELDETNR